MRCTSIARWLRHLFSVVAAVLAVNLPWAAAARGGGGGGGGIGGFHSGGIGLGTFHGGAVGMGAVRGGGFFRGGFVAAPHGAVGVFGFGPRAVSRFHHDGFLHGVHRFHRGGVLRFGKVFLTPREAFLVPRGLRGPRFGTIGIPPLTGMAVPPLAGTAVPAFTGTAIPPLGGVVAPLPIRPRVGAVEIWRWNGGVWHRDPTLPPATVWQRDDNGDWHPETAD